MHDPSLNPRTSETVTGTTPSASSSSSQTDPGDPDAGKQATPGPSVPPSFATSPTQDPDSPSEPPTIAEAPPPTGVGRYRITARLGAGSFGVVYQGYDGELQRDVAVKVPHRHRVASPEAVAFVLTFAAGGILAMLAETMFPEAYEHGGKLVGIATTLGFVVAFGIHQLS